MERVARRVRVTGLVQEVFFRAWTQEQAQRLGVAGWVRNCRDGSVEAHLEGEAQAVEQLLSLMRRGPPGARVDDVEVAQASPQPMDCFEIRH